MKDDTPSVQQQVTDRTAQREKLREFFLSNPSTLFTQETLAEACGADIGAVRTRCSELKRAGMSLIAVPQTYRDEHGRSHRAKKMWEYVPRPPEPLGRDAGTYVQKTLWT